MTTVAVIAGGTSAEHPVSLASAQGVVTALAHAGFTTQTLTIGTDGVWHHNGEALASTAHTSLTQALRVLGETDVVFPVVHGLGGEDGALAALCDLAHLPMVGSPLAPAAFAMDKWVTKLIAQAVGIAVAPGRVVHASHIADIDATEVVEHQPVVVKPVTAGSSHGVSLVEDEHELLPALSRAAQHDERILIEHVVHGREIDVAVVRTAGGVRWAAPPLEIKTERLFDTDTKYNGTATFEVPARLTRSEQAPLTAAALRMFDALQCQGVARLDFFLTDDGPLLNEVNTTPGMTAESQVPRMFAAGGVDYPTLVRLLVDAALDRVTTSAARPSKTTVV